MRLFNRNKNNKKKDKKAWIPNITTKMVLCRGVDMVLIDLVLRFRGVGMVLIDLVLRFRGVGMVLIQLSGQRDLPAGVSANWLLTNPALISQLQGAWDLSSTASTRWSGPDPTKVVKRPRVRRRITEE
jgi:hypothetical protein